MAEEFFAATVRVLLGKAISMATNRMSLMLGFYKDLKAMEGYLNDIQAVLADAETKQSQNPIVLRWLKKVEGAAFEAEHVLDELLYESLRRKVYETKGGAAKVCSFFPLTRHSISFRTRMGSRVRAINGKLKLFNNAVLDIGLIRIEDSLLSHDDDVPVEVANRQTDSLPQQFVVGRVKEECEIVDMLLTSSLDNNVSVIPIVGMGGLGKTTLAKQIYNNVKIEGHFSKRSWICVSDKFEVMGILKGILESLKGGEKVEISIRDAIVQGIQNEVSGERFLFVLDDVWNEDPKLWDNFFTTLVGLKSANGSCCVLTTRLQTTANLVSTFFNPFLLDDLSDDACWSIIGIKATKDGEIPSDLDVHRERILKKCQGLPLVANVIGGLLSLQRKDDWVSIVENKILKVSNSVEREIMPILKLSCDYLPSPYIKKCFIYCSIYPKDTKLNAEELIELWMGEGFLQEDMHGILTMEDVGTNYLTILLQSSLLEKVNGLYQMHDLVHDLAEFISKLEQFDGKYHYLQYRHLAIGEEELKHKWNEKSILAQIENGEISNEILLKYRHMRILHMLSTKTNNLPNAIGKLKYIRYLDLSVEKIKSLPEFVCKLYNLQTLKLEGCDNLQCLPKRLSSLIRLRHLHFYSWDCELRMPTRMGRLTCLQTLRFFNVGEKNGRGIKELGSMNNLKSNLNIRNLELVKGKDEAKSANMFEKLNMKELDLSWGVINARENIDICEDDHVLEGLEPCLNLQKLIITGFMGIGFPQWLGKLPSLVELELHDCKNCREIVSLDNDAFPKLASLIMYECCQLSAVSTHFPTLETLKMWGSVQASAVRDIISKSTSLKFISLYGVSGMSSLSDVIGNQRALSLKEFRICVFHDLTDIPRSTFEFCTYLESFRVKESPNLLSCPIDLQLTPSLSTLMFSGCPKAFTINAMPRGFKHLTKLKRLSIGPFSDDSIQLFDWSGLVQGCSTTLQNLHLDGSLQKHALLPEQLQHFSLLLKLELKGFESLERLPNWFANLTSLQKLELRNCPKLQATPLAHDMESLNNLRKTLEICNCPLLEDTLAQDISDFPNLTIMWRAF